MNSAMKNYLITTSNIKGGVCVSVWHEKFTDGVRRFKFDSRVKDRRLFSTSVYGLAVRGGASNVKSSALSLLNESSIYMTLARFIDKNPLNYNTQLEIEKALMQYSYNKVITSNEINKLGMGIDYSIMNKKFVEILIEKRTNLVAIIKNFGEGYTSMKLKDKVLKDRAYTLTYEVLTVVPIDYIIDVLYGRVLRIFSSNNIKKDGGHHTATAISHDLGEDLINRYFYTLYSKESKGVMSFSEWKDANDTLVAKGKDASLMFSLGSVLVDWLISCELIKLETKISGKEVYNILVGTKEILDTLPSSVIAMPTKLPMLVKPKLYKRVKVDGKWKEELGGYLLNDEFYTDRIFIENHLLKDVSIIEPDNKIYSLVNNISSVGYQINTSLLEFIKGEGFEFLKEELIMTNYEHPLFNEKKKRKLTKREDTELQAFISKRDTQEHILQIAEVYSKVHEFFIPVRLDNRGRLYCLTDYLHYQSTDLAKSLLLFSRGEKIYKYDFKVYTQFLELYGANCFGNNLDKKSAEERLKWVSSNMEGIVNYKNGELIKKAENKFLFIAFCIEYERYLNCQDNPMIDHFITYFPVQLDATCNGFQHLALLCLDTELALELNLSKSNWGDMPRDFYGFIAGCLVNYFKEQSELEKDLEKREGFVRLSNMEIQRKIIKKSIMTIPYNVSTLQLINYIKENFSNCEDTEWIYLKDNPEIKIKYKDLFLLGDGLRVVLRIHFPKLDILIKYLKKVATICSKLELHIPWTLPSGMTVKQSYLKSNEVRLKPFSYLKTSFVLRIVDKNKYDLTKQVRAFMPNLVHSLDAASLALLVDLYFNESKEHKNMYTVHDCFAVTYNNVLNLMDLLKVVYIRLYSEDTYLLKLDKQIRDHIINSYGEDSFSDNLTLNIDSIKGEKFPDVREVLGTVLNFDFEGLKGSKYLIK